MSDAQAFVANSTDSFDTSTLCDRVYEYLTDKILQGDIGYNEKLSVRKIADSLDVSPTPVREAIKRLQYENVVSAKPRSKFVVQQPTRRSMLDAFELREVLEYHAISRVYDSVGPADLENLEAYVNKMEACLPINEDQRRMQSYTKFDQLFHQEICALTRNQYLVKAYRANMLHLNIAMTFRAGLPPDMGQVSRDHRNILEHLKQNSPEAVEILKRHLERCKYNMVHGELFQSLG